LTPSPPELDGDSPRLLVARLAERERMATLWHRIARAEQQARAMAYTWLLVAFVLGLIVGGGACMLATHGPW
jgi:hypothetical protein